MSADTVPVPGNEVLPAGSVAVAVTVSPSTRVPGFGTDQLPSVPATTVAVVPSGKLTVTVESGSAVPVIGSTAFTGSMSGAFGATVSIVTVPVSVPVLPAKSVAVTVMVCGPSLSAGKVLSASVQVPSPLLVAG
ncbi:hypothetical protein MWMV18_MWMV18_03608 [Acinetobacter calcoaceticus]|nr:hypothetical protein MWMV18_MWMV18_03608 [Acinetobacter calcoaceticus]